MEWILIIWIAGGANNLTALEYFPDRSACQSAGEVWKSTNTKLFGYQCLPRAKT